MIESLQVYIPIDRRHALARGEALPDRARGATLFADISGFTPLTEALANELGPQRGAEELTRHLNNVYDALIAELEQYGGSVISFSGDAITCWFDSDAGWRATACALAMQRAMSRFAAVTIPSGAAISLGMKAAVAIGTARRFLVGDPELQIIDVLAGAVLDRLAAAEHRANKGEVVVEPEVIAALGDAIEIRSFREDEAGQHFGVVERLVIPVPVAPWPPLPGEALSEEQVRPWLLPTVYERLRSGQGEFLAELRPAIALFLRFGGINYEEDDHAQMKLDIFIRGVQHILAHYEGTLLQLTIGDKGSYLYAAFGTPTAHEDDAERAASAALELRALGKSIAFMGDMQIGLAQGRMRTGAYGGLTRRTYGALGDDVNLAARLMQAAAPGQILVTSAVAKGVGQTFSLTALEPIQLKGKAKPIPVFTLAALARHPVHLQEPTYALPMVGRQAELASIGARLELAAGGKGQIMGIAAEAGMGKSRLVAEVVKHAIAQGFLGYSGTCQSFGAHSSYLVWREIWETYFGLDPAAPAAEQIERLERELTELEPSLVDRLPLLSAVLNLTIPENPLTLSLDSQLRKESLEALLVDCVRARVARRDIPLLFIFEDCHWIDPLSDDLLAALGRSIQNERVLVLLTYRPLEPAAQILSVMSGPNANVISLNDFTPDEAQRLIELKLSQFGQALGTIPPALVEQITLRAEGNPFYIEELLNYLRDRQDARHDLRALEAVGLPDSLHSLILSRIDRLSESEKVTIKVASVIGRSFPFKWLWGTYPDLSGAEDVRADLAQLDRLDLTPLDIPEPELRYLFKHAVTQQVAYESQPFAARAQMHGNLGGFLERTYVDTLDKFLDLLAYHYGHSVDIPKQREYYRRAGIAAEAAYAPEIAITYYREALAIWPAPHDANEAAQRFDVYEGLGRMLVNRARYGEASETFRTMLEQARAAEMPAVESRAWYGLSSAQSSAGDQRAALDSAAQAERLAQQAGATRELSAALEMKGRCLFRLGDASAALALGEQMLTLATQHEMRLQMPPSLNLIGAAHHILGHYDAAQTAWERAFEIAEALNDRRRMMSLLNNLGVNAQGRGDHRQALVHYQKALETAREIGHRDGEIMFLGNVGEARVYLGDFELAEVDLRQIMEMETAESARNLAATPFAEALLGQERLDEALEAARRALAMQQGAGDQALLAATWRVLGQAAVRLEQPILIRQTGADAERLYTAADCFAKSIRVCEELGMEGERARTLREWANDELLKGNYDEGVLKWVAARDLFAHLGADFEVARMQDIPGRNQAVNPPSAASAYS